MIVWSIPALFLLVCLALCITCHPRFDDGSAVGLTAGMFGVAAVAVQSALVLPWDAPDLTCVP